MNTIEEFVEDLQQRLSQQGWVEDYEVTKPEIHSLVSRLLLHVFGNEEQRWEQANEPVIAKAADRQRISALLKNIHQLQKRINESKHILDPLDHRLNAESRPEEISPLSARLTPLLGDLDMAGRIAIHPLRTRRRGAPQKKDQEGLITGIAHMVEKILARHGRDKHKPSKAEVARVAAGVLRLINVRVEPKRIQNLFKHPN